MRIALDTNVALRHINRDDPQHAHVVRCLKLLIGQGNELCIAPQAIYEFWVVATRPVKVNGLGLGPGAVRGQIDLLMQTPPVIADPPDLLKRWLDLCSHHEVRGRQAHDARLVAWMLGNELDKLLTLNPGDFGRYAEIECLLPADVLGPGIDRHPP